MPAGPLDRQRIRPLSYGSGAFGVIQVSSLHKTFADRVLFDRVTWQVQPGQRIGLCGPNGSGKTTLLRMLAGEVEPDAGQIVCPSGLTVGYLPQDGLTHAGRTLRDEATLAFAPLLALQDEMQRLEGQLADPAITGDAHDELLHRYAEAQEAFTHGDGYGIEAKVDAVLRGLGFAPGDFDRPAEHFSGGWQMRIALAKLLLARPRLLLLDEPTNHLDLEARNWLEEFLIEYPHPVVLVSHDRYFLDTVVTAIADINLRTLDTYPGTYSAYLTDRDARVARLRAAKQQQDEDIARIQLFIDRFRYKASKAKQVQSRVKMLEKITPIEVPPERKKVHFTFPASARSGRTVVELRGAAKAYGDVRVFGGVNLHIERGDRLALVGPNGAGKSTLMRILSGAEAPDGGERTVGYRVHTQYFAQDEATRLDPALTVYETLATGSPVDMVPAIRNILGGFLFTEDDIYKRVRVLSGGERTRLAVARMLLRPSNTLILDEPTNHLDIDSTDVLLEALDAFGGTLIFVSHDRYFVDKLATKVLDIGGGDAVLYPGTYEEFRWSRTHAGAPAAPPSATVIPPATGTRRGGPKPAPKASPRTSASAVPAAVPATGSKRPPSAAEHKRRQVEARRQERRTQALRRRIAELERRIAEREEEIRGLETKMAAPDLYADETAATGMVKRHQALMWEVGDLMNQWEALEEEAADRDRAAVMPAGGASGTRR